MDSALNKGVNQLLRHVLMWYKSDWVLPERAENSRKDFQWLNEVTEWVLKAKMADGGRRGYSDDTDDLNELGKKLVQTVWETYKDDEAWYDAHVQAEVSPITTFLM